MNGATFRLYRLCMGWEVKRTAEIFGYDRRTIQRWENGSWDIPIADQERMVGYWQDFIDGLTDYVELIEDSAEEAEAMGDPVPPIEFTLTDNPENLARIKALAVAFAIDEFDVIAKN